MLRQPRQQRKVFLLKPEYPVYACSGSRGAGKSSLVEYIENYYYDHNYIILDWFGSLDHENAFACIADIKEVAAWDKLPGEHTTRFFEYLRIFYDLNLQDATIEKTDVDTLQVRNDDTTIIVKVDRWKARARLMIDGIQKHMMLARKNDSKELCLYGRNPARKHEEKLRLVGLPILIILPRTTIISQNNPLCICGVPLADHDNNYYYCKKNLELIKTVTDDVPLKEILQLAHREKRFCIFNRGFYMDQRDAYRTLAKLLKELPYLVLRKAIPTSISICLGLRELGSIAPSGLKGMAGTFETNCKREIQTLIRESRHVRVTMAVDFQRSTDIAKSIASQRDFFIFKRSTRDLISDDYVWMYDLINDKRKDAAYGLDFAADSKYPSISKLKHHQAYILFPDRHFELRTHPLPPFHHKRPDDNWAEMANCSIEYLEKKSSDKSAIESEIKRLKEKERKQIENDEVVKQAIFLYENEDLTWPEVAKKIGWLDDTGNPNAARLKMAVKRYKESNQSDAGQ